MKARCRGGVVCVYPRPAEEQGRDGLMLDESAWGKWEYDDDDDGAGNERDQLDMIELTIVLC